MSNPNQIQYNNNNQIQNQNECQEQYQNQSQSHGQTDTADHGVRNNPRHDQQPSAGSHLRVNKTLPPSNVSRTTSSNGAGLWSTLFPKYSSADHDQPQHQIQESRLDRYRRQRNEAREFNRELQKVNEEQELNIKSLEADLAEQHEAVNNVRESATRIHQIMEDKSLYLGPQALDRTVQQGFDGIIKKIRTFSRFFGIKSIDFDRTVSLLGNEIDAIAPRLGKEEVRKLLASSKSYRRYFFRGWLAYKICEAIFPALPGAKNYESNTPSSRDPWLDRRFAAAVETIEQTFDINCNEHLIKHRDLNDWRAYTISLLSKVCDSNRIPPETEIALDQFQTTIMKFGSTWCDLVTDEMRKELASILLEAVRFSRFCRTQRAQWTVKYPVFQPGANKSLSTNHPTTKMLTDSSFRAPIYFNQQTMKSVEPHEEDESLAERVVLLILGPMLLKQGDADGRKFDIESIIDPYMVLLANPGPTQLTTSLHPPLDHEIARSQATEAQPEYVLNQTETVRIESQSGDGQRGPRPGAPPRRSTNSSSQNLPNQPRNQQATHDAPSAAHKVSDGAPTPSDKPSGQSVPSRR